MINIIQYGIGEEYLKDWGVQEALREIYQNFMDYGTFKQKVRTTDHMSHVILSNTYEPEDLEFLQIGKSVKGGNKEAIGQHGEGLKMAMLVFLRLGYHIDIHTPTKMIKPIWKNQKHIGKTLALQITDADVLTNFIVEYSIPTEDFNVFNNNLIKKKDVLFTAEPHGDIVDKEVGNLYVGRLFVCKLKNFKKSYNIRPSVLKLDRDRRVPNSFDTSWHTSKINEAEQKFNFVDQDMDDMKYVSKVPESMYKDIKPRLIGNNVEFIAKVGKEEIVIKNDSIKSHLRQQSYFSKALQGIKKFLLARMGVIEMLVAFRAKYCYNIEAQHDFDAILEKLGINIGKHEDLPF